MKSQVHMAVNINVITYFLDCGKRVRQAGKKWNMIQETWYWDQSHKQTVETGGAEKGLFSE
jgi:hypothetical protein